MTERCSEYMIKMHANRFKNRIATNLPFVETKVLVKLNKVISAYMCLSYGIFYYLKYVIRAFYK